MENVINNNLKKMAIQHVYDCVFCSPLLTDWCYGQLEKPVVRYLVDWLLSERVDI